MGAYLALYQLSARIVAAVLTDPIIGAFVQCRDDAAVTLDAVVRAYTSFTDYAAYRAWHETLPAQIAALERAVPVARIFATDDW